MADEPENTQTDPTPTSVVASATTAGDAPSPGATPGKPLEKGGTGKATVRTRYPVDRFDHSVKGVDPITSAGVEVDRSKVGALLKDAEETGTELEEVENA